MRDVGLALNTLSRYREKLTRFIGLYGSQQSVSPDRKAGKIHRAM